jgi:hypothetical protein
MRIITVLLVCAMAAGCAGQGYRKANPNTGAAMYNAGQFILSQEAMRQQRHQWGIQNWYSQQQLLNQHRKSCYYAYGSWTCR